MEKGHSEEYFNEDRDFWWNHDFLELMARRLRLHECSLLLDVGCGQCHWSRLLADFLKKPATIHAIDTDPKWASGSDTLRQAFGKQDAKVEFKLADAQSLPYEDNSFDIVTCQTMLIHVPDPKKAVEEMHRVVKPGGLVLCAEPNNLSAFLVRSNASANDPIQAIIQSAKYELMRERGKAQLGEGDNSYGDLLPGTFAEIGFEDIRVYLSDKAQAIYPPYRHIEQQAALNASQEMECAGTGLFDVEQNRRYLSAIGQEACLEAMQKHLKDENARIAQATKSGSYATGGGNIMYLVSGRKVEQAHAADSDKPRH